MAYGRVLLALGEKEAARQYLATMAQQNLDDDGRKLMAIYAEWLKALEGEAEAAMKMLEEFMQENQQTLAAAEAADVLAILHIARNEQDKAKRAVDFGLATIKYVNVKTDYLEALLRGRLKNKSAASDAEKLYLAAEKLREDGKYQEAGQQFMQLRRQHPDTVWAHAAGFRIGQCLLSLNRAQQAVEHWTAFIGELPEGPWRGQARVAVLDYVLETNLDLTIATEQAIAASSTLAKSLDKEVAESWQEAAFDIHLRQGIVSLVDGRFDAAAKALHLAKPLAPKKDEALAAGIARMIELAENREALLPNDVMENIESRAQTALALGNLNWPC